VKEETELKPTSMNAFELISLNQGLNLDNLFEAKEVRTLKYFYGGHPFEQIMFILCCLNFSSETTSHCNELVCKTHVAGT
jgi:hypothetical protein